MAFGINRFRFIVSVLIAAFLCLVSLVLAGQLQEPSVAGAFYPQDAAALMRQVDAFLDEVQPAPVEGDIFALISPHAGYDYSGKVAAYGYKLVRGKPYKTVIVIGVYHQGFKGVSIYPKGIFRTPLGDVKVDEDFTALLAEKNKDISFEKRVFQNEHSLEVQLPFLQRALPECKIVPIMMGDCSFDTCQQLAGMLKNAIGGRKDVLVVASTDLYHGYDFEEAVQRDNDTLSYIVQGDAEGLYHALREGKTEMCGGFPVVTTLILAGELGHKNTRVLKHTNSCEVAGKKIKGVWTVGYASIAVDAPLEQKEGEKRMLNEAQRKKLLALARNSIEAYLKTGKKLRVSDDDPVLQQSMGAFVTLHEKGELRGCIGNLVGTQPLYLTIRDMAIEAATGDPRFKAVTLDELSTIEVEISALSPLKRMSSAAEFQLGVHGVLIRKGMRSGVFLPQVATETGWSKEEFLSNLCAHKAGLSADAWKDSATEMYLFTAEVFSESNY